MRNSALVLFTALTGTALAGCQEKVYCEKNGDPVFTAAECFDDVDDDGSVPDDGTGMGGGETFDLDDDGEADGTEDPFLAIGSYVYQHISILPAGSPEIYTFGYGFGGVDGWCDDRHQTEKVTGPDGDYWWRIYLVNYEDEYRINFGTPDACESDALTHWDDLEHEAKDDPFAWNNEEDDTWSFCATHNEDHVLVPGDCDSNDD